MLKPLIQYLFIVLAFVASSEAMVLTIHASQQGNDSPGPRPIGAGGYPLTPMHASAWFGHRAESDGKLITLMVYFEGSPGWHDKTTNFSWAVNSSPARIDMRVGSTPITIAYWPETMAVKILDQSFNLASNNVFLVRGIDERNPEVRGLGTHDLAFDTDDNPSLVLVKRNPEIRASLLNEQVALRETPNEAVADLIALDRKGMALIKKNDPKSDLMACELFRQAAMRGYAESQYRLGYCYESGRGVAQDATVGNHWYLKAAQQGHVNAQYKLGHSYRVGRGVVPDLGVALKWYKKAAESGDVDAQYNVGWMYATGQGVEVNAEEAVKWFLKAADNGSETAQYEIVRRYRLGNGVAKDIPTAYQWLLVLESQRLSFAPSDWKEIEALLISVKKEISTEARVVAEGRAREWLRAYSKRYLERLKD